jgi:hypothetical protein
LEVLMSEWWSFDGVASRTVEQILAKCGTPVAAMELFSHSFRLLLLLRTQGKEEGIRRKI